MNNENLRKLANYLEIEHEKLNFDMNSILEDKSGEYIQLIAVKETNVCGTIGCALGHAPFAGIPIENDTDWIKYSFRVFGFASNDIGWEWCFSDYWSEYDNTAIGAAKRIRYLLKNGVPEGFGEDHLEINDLEEYVREYSEYT